MSRKEDDYMKGNFILFFSSVEVKREKLGFFFFLTEKDMKGNSNYDYLWK